MLSLRNYFIEPNYDILYETNIDQLFDIFEKSLNKIDNSDDFGNIFTDLIETKPIEIYKFETKNKDLTQLKGGWGINDKTKNYYITIEYPKTINPDILNKQIIRTMLHELLHILNDEKIPNFITKRIKTKNQTIEQRFNTRNSIDPHTYNFYEVNIDDMTKYLEYVSHLREKANFAFTIALSCYFDMNNMSPEEVFDDNFKRIKEFNTGQIDIQSFNRYVTNQKTDTIELLSMQWAMFHVGQKKYINQIYSILRLSVKYWKRLNKLLGEPYAT